MCDHENREAAMVTIRRGPFEIPTIWCDPCLEPIIEALNAGGLPTVASCCGHGQRPGRISLRDGRELFLVADYEAATVLEQLTAPEVAEATCPEHHGRDCQRPECHLPPAPEAVGTETAAWLEAGPFLGHLVDATMTCTNCKRWLPEGDYTDIVCPENPNSTSTAPVDETAVGTWIYCGKCVTVRRHTSLAPDGAICSRCGTVRDAPVDETSEGEPRCPDCRDQGYQRLSCSIENHRADSGTDGGGGE